MQTVKRGRREIIVVTVDLKPFEPRNRRLRPLPYVPDHVVEIAERELRHRTARRVVLQIDVPRGRLPIRLVRVYDMVAEEVPLLLGGKPNARAGLRALPVAECLGLQVIDLHGPIPGHVDLLRDRPQSIRPVGRDPKQGVRGLLVRAPLPALFGPPTLRRIPGILHKREEFPVADKVATRQVSLDVLGVCTELVVPSIEWMILLLSEHDAPRGYGDQLVLRRRARLAADFPQRMGTDVLDRQLPDENRRGFEVNPRMLDAHHDHPPRTVPRNRQLERHRPDGLVHDGANAIAIRLHFRDGRPVVVFLVQVVPRHLVHAHGKHGFAGRVKPALQESRQNELVDVESRRVAEVEDKRMPQGIRASVEGLVIP